MCLEIYLFNGHISHFYQNWWTVHISGVAIQRRPVHAANTFLQSRFNRWFLDAYGDISSEEQFQRLRFLLSKTASAGIQISVYIPRLNEHYIAETDENGFFYISALLSIPDDLTHHETLDFKAWIIGGDCVFDGKCFIVMPVGLTVISDVDETLKPFGYYGWRPIYSLCYKKYKPIIGMRDILLDVMSDTVDPVIFYVSGCPWQIIPSIRWFLDEFTFPDGIFAVNHLNFLTGSNRTSSVFSFAKMDKLKFRHWVDIIESNPCRQYVLIGDSCMADAKMFASILEMYSAETVRFVLLRLVKKKTNFADRHTLRKIKRRFRHCDRDRVILLSDIE